MLHRKDAYFGLHFDLHPQEREDSYGEDMTEENLGAFLDRIKPDYLTYDCKGHPGYCNYETKFGISSQNLRVDVLHILRRATAQRKISLGVHYSGLIDQVQTEVHPEYAAMDAKGRTIAAKTSVFGRYTDEVMLPQMTEIVNRYQLDGIWVDGECWGAELDYTPAAKAAWREYRDTPPPSGSEDADWAMWKEFHRKRFEQYLEYWVTELQKACPELDICSNWSYTSQMPVPMKAPVHMITGDVVPKYVRERLRMETRYLPHYGKPWELMLWGGGWTEGETNKMPKPAVQLQQEMAPILVHGGSVCVYYNPTRGGLIPEDTAQTLEQLSSFCRVRRAFCFHSSPVPQAAVIFPSVSYLSHSDMVYGLWDSLPDEVDGVLEAMIHSHYSCCVLDEHMLPGKLNSYQYVILPECDVLPPETLVLLKEYVKNGGNLFVCGQKACEMFEDELGVRLGDAGQVDTKLCISGREIFANGIWNRPEIKKAEVLLERVEAQNSYPAVTINRFGKGQIAGVYGNLPRLYFNTHYQGFREVFNLVAQRLFTPDVLVDAPRDVEVCMRTTAGGNLCVHLMNMLGRPDFDRHRFVDDIPRLCGITLKIRAPKPGKVVYEPDGTLPEFSYTDGWVTVRNIELYIHGAVVLYDGEQ